MNWTQQDAPLMDALKEIYDTSTAADLTVMEESAELLEHVTAGNELPLFSSCCPAWVRYVETKHQIGRASCRERV